ncbi:MAG: pyroglutamyl-peptidase I [Chloracidobacterium sp.]|uniref:Pyroglutamyl-peptidase I n=1 Tax=Chloracidobacterium validum TaxID=2821543 RepID=A0ABX8BD56_9BACT|nr:pyroglutamyl-peptidase I [Chloracidobacterium validum]QUW03775.1 pyroglutamyl-peptidase I [Chloracidobacterium validum]
MLKVFVTGFEPFDQLPINPTETVALTVNTPVGLHVMRFVLPVVAETCVTRLLQAIEAERPAAVLALGLAVGRAVVSLERVAVNLDDFSRPDNAGNLRYDTPIVPDGPPTLWTTLPIRHMEKALKAADIPVEISYSAGTYVCNHLFYQVQYALQRQPGRCRFGFVHLPPTPDLGRAGLPLSTQLRAVERLLETLRDTTEQDVWSNHLL